MNQFHGILYFPFSESIFYGKCTEKNIREIDLFDFTRILAWIFLIFLACCEKEFISAAMIMIKPKTYFDKTTFAVEITHMTRVKKPDFKMNTHKPWVTFFLKLMVTDRSSTVLLFGS